MEYKPIRIDLPTYNKIAKLAHENGRSLVGQLRWWVNHSDTARAPITDSNSTVCQGAGGVEVREERKDV